MELHWTSTSSDPSGTNDVATVRLEAGLSGPFASIAALKAAVGAPSIHAPVVVAPVTGDRAAVSIIRIPQDAPAGFYNLTTSISHSDVRYSAGSVITVEAN